MTVFLTLEIIVFYMVPNDHHILPMKELDNEEFFNFMVKNIETIDCQAPSPVVNVNNCHHQLTSD